MFIGKTEMYLYLDNCLIYLIQGTLSHGSPLRLPSYGYLRWFSGSICAIPTHQNSIAVISCAQHSSGCLGYVRNEAGRWPGSYDTGVVKRWCVRMA